MEAEGAPVAAVAEGEGGVAAAPAVPAVDPKDLPKLSLAILMTVHEAQSAHGLRRNVPDYARYRKCVLAIATTLFLTSFLCARFCTVRLGRLRKSLRFLYGKKKFTYHELTPEVVKNERYLLLALVNAERCWAYHLDLAREQEQQKDTNSRIRFHAAKRLKKAAKWARQLAQLCEVRADERTRIEATGYASWMAGLLARERLAWREATDAFFVAQTVFAKLAQVGDAEHRAVAQGRADTIEPLVAYCAYRLGGAADRSTMDKALQEKLDAYLASSAQEQAKQQSVAWEGRDIEIPAVAAASVSRARFEALEAAATEAAVAEPMGLVRACGACEKLMVRDWAGRARSRTHSPVPVKKGSLSDVADVCAKHGETTWGRQLGAWTRAEQAKAGTRRNNLLVRLAAVRAWLDGAGPTPSDEPACARPVEDKEAFAEASHEYVGAGRVTCITVARILDGLAAQAMPAEDAREEDRRAAAAAVLRYRGLRALFLARHEAHARAWAEALALAARAATLLEESAALAPSAEARREAQAAGREARVMRVSAAATGQQQQEAPQPTLAQLLAADTATVTAKPVAGKPSLFDLAGAEIKFPSLEGRLKKKGFFSSFW